eukprot:1188288-Prymnesium_polylepis.1
MDAGPSAACGFELAPTRESCVHTELVDTSLFGGVTGGGRGFLQSAHVQHSRAALSLFVFVRSQRVMIDGDACGRATVRISVVVSARGASEKLSSTGRKIGSFGTARPSVTKRRAWTLAGCVVARAVPCDKGQARWTSSTGP